MNRYGLTENGFRRKSYGDILSDMEASARELFGDNVNLTERSPLGMFLKVIAWNQAEIWQMAEDVYNAGYIDTAEGLAQDNVSKFVTIERKAAQKAEGYILVSGNEGTRVPAGFRVETGEDAILFETTEERRIPAAGEIEIPIRAVRPGENGNVPANTINRIVNPIAGIREVINPEQLENGTDTEKDHEFRERYYRSISKGGSSTRASVEAALLNLANIEDAFVEENETMQEIDDIPPKSLAPYVFGGDDIEIAETILKSKAGGIRSYGDTEITVKDSRGADHTIGFTRPSTKDIYMNIELSKKDDYTGDGNVKQALIEYIGGQDVEGRNHRGLRIGENVTLSKIIAKSMVQGVKDVFVELSTDGEAFDTTNIEIGPKEIARTSWDKVVISHV